MAPDKCCFPFLQMILRGQHWLEKGMLWMVPVAMLVLYIVHLCMNFHSTAVMSKDQPLESLWHDHWIFYASLTSRCIACLCFNLAHNILLWSIGIQITVFWVCTCMFLFVLDFRATLSTAWLLHGQSSSATLRGTQRKSTSLLMPRGRHTCQIPLGT